MMMQRSSLTGPANLDVFRGAELDAALNGTRDKSATTNQLLDLRNSGTKPIRDLTPLIVGKMNVLLSKYSSANGIATLTVDPFMGCRMIKFCQNELQILKGDLLGDSEAPCPLDVVKIFVNMTSILAFAGSAVGVPLDIQCSSTTNGQMFSALELITRTSETIMTEMGGLIAQFLPKYLNPSLATPVVPTTDATSAFLAFCADMKVKTSIGREPSSYGLCKLVRMGQRWIVTMLKVPTQLPYSFSVSSTGKTCTFDFASSGTSNCGKPFVNGQAVDPREGAVICPCIPAGGLYSYVSQQTSPYANKVPNTGTIYICSCDQSQPGSIPAEGYTTRWDLNNNVVTTGYPYLTATQLQSGIFENCGVMPNTAAPGTTVTSLPGALVPAVIALNDVGGFAGFWQGGGQTAICIPTSGIMNPNEIPASITSVDVAISSRVRVQGAFLAWGNMVNPIVASVGYNTTPAQSSVFGCTVVSYPVWDKSCSIPGGPVTNFEYWSQQYGRACTILSAPVVQNFTFNCSVDVSSKFSVRVPPSACVYVVHHIFSSTGYLCMLTPDDITTTFSYSASVNPGFVGTSSPFYWNGSAMVPSTGTSLARCLMSAGTPDPNYTRVCTVMNNYDDLVAQAPFGSQVASALMTMVTGVAPVSTTSGKTSASWPVVCSVAGFCTSMESVRKLTAAVSGPPEAYVNNPAVRPILEGLLSGAIDANLD